MSGIILTTLMSAAIHCSNLTGRSAKDFTWEKSVCTQLGKDYQKVSLVPLRNIIKDTTNSKDERELLQGMTLQGGRLKVVVNEKVNNNSLHEVTYFFNVDAYKEVWVLKRSIKSGSILQENDISRKSVNVAPFVGIKTFIETAPIGKKLKNSQKKGSALFTDSVENPDIIAIGDTLTAVIIGGNISIEMSAIALENGGDSSDKIKVRLVTTGATFEATIKGSKNVQIDI